MQRQLENIREYLILGIVFLFPFTFAGTFIDSFTIPKLIVLGTLICLSLIVVAIQIYLTGKFKIGIGKFDLPIFLIAFSYLISAILVTPNKMEAFFLPGNASIVIGFAIFYFLLNTIADKNKIKLTLFASVTCFAILIFASFLGVFDKISNLPSFMKLASFNPAGDYLTGAILLLSVVPFAINYVVKENILTKKTVFAFGLVFVLVAAGISLFTLVSSDKKIAPTLPSFATSWATAVGTIGENPVLGIGPGNYITAFNRFRPVTYNATDLWQLRFSTARDFYLTVLTETGLLGMFAVFLLIFYLIKQINRNLTIYKESRSVVVDMVSTGTLLGLLIIFFIFPTTPVSLFLIFVFFSLISQAKVQEVGFFEGSTSATGRVLASLAIIACVFYFGIKAKPVIQAEAIFKNANDALSANDGKTTYTDLQSAINLNPMVDRYHASYAQVNLAIARSIATSVADPKSLTQDQQNTILQLIQQAIREGQNTVTLNSTRSQNWQILANIYQLIIPYAQQADQFALQSYSQAITLDPIDPNLRIALGGLYYSLGQYDSAIGSFQFAVYAKPDLANAYYNLASGYAAKSDFTNAVAAMNQVILLVPKNSNDYKTAQETLTDYQNKQKTTATTNNGNSSLTTPQKETPAINPQITLPEEASPPAAPKIPSATATPVATNEGGQTEASPTPLP
ncbi:MAG TPA: hypothetical protein VG895_00695 [Patescibacteria group bacterium]|nr:hypothetical protein [Patescibacteria group bacterium]